MGNGKGDGEWRMVMGNAENGKWIEAPGNGGNLSGKNCDCTMYSVVQELRRFGRDSRKFGRVRTAWPLLVQVS
jgi:hypothetical protein